MRLSNTTLGVLVAVLLASGTAVSKADQTSVSNVNVVHSSLVLADEDKRFLRSHHTTDGEGEHDEEERKGGDKLFYALKIQKMQTDPLNRFHRFGKWKTAGYSTKDVEKKNIPKELYRLYKAYRRMHG
ncbi:hypothetical protein PF005_g21303 [Phytophthora fragariae]|uniref:RxLR effector protein n=1 Tax=Phytophthora fragariae TaxID=53985 RepID=A0A6A3PW25_9STRA|nr:hypothetical protein PF009_g31807 [Phytophthora fragariae]KAE9057642.1 hypothetical protein PF010_g31297 [Phytophthora fragariae]KAE9058567.1 hypothetical protein PF007_g31254 [Phytophthora fragariae]KAE9060958.1 hypothetical protein PF006_g31520 [Phytophthora fragariae]KAE9160821.1 hypothetical protein PF004_g31040 [Phytophthora fragariae]